MRINIYEILKLHEQDPKAAIYKIYCDVSTIEEIVSIAEQCLTIKLESNNDYDNARFLAEGLLFGRNDEGSLGEFYNGVLGIAISKGWLEVFNKLLQNENSSVLIKKEIYKHIENAYTHNRFSMLEDLLDVVKIPLHEIRGGSLLLELALAGGYFPLARKLLKCPEILEKERANDWSSFKEVSESVVIEAIEFMYEIVSMKEVRNNSNLLDLFSRVFYEPELIKERTDKLDEIMFHFAKGFWGNIRRVPASVIDNVRRGGELHIEKVRLFYNFSKAFGYRGEQVSDQVLLFLPGYQDMVIRRIAKRKSLNTADARIVGVSDSIEDSDIEMKEISISNGAGLCAGASDVVLPEDDIEMHGINIGNGVGFGAGLGAGASGVTLPEDDIEMNGEVTGSNSNSYDTDEGDDSKMDGTDDINIMLKKRFRHS